MIRWTALAVALLVILACGGGGGGGVPTSATLVGRVLSIETAGGTVPSSSVQVGTASTLTSNDGTFQLTVPTGTTSITIDTRSAWGTFTYTIAPASGTTDVGDLWVGPGKVQVKGRVLNSATNAPVEAAIVNFAGRQATTNAAGMFTLNEVAYSGSTQTAFWGIVGSSSRTGFFRTDWSASPNLAIAGVVTVNDILMTPSDDINPPPLPYNLWGRVNPSNLAPGTTVTLKEAGVAVRITTVNNDSTYFFWVQPGTYTMEFRKGTLAADASATLNAPNEVLRRDVTLQ